MPGTGVAQRWRRWSRTTRRTLVLCLVLLAVDAVLLGAHWGHRLDRAFDLFPAFAHPGWNADLDRSFAEVFGYLQLLLAAVALLVVVTRVRAARPFLLAAAATLLVMVLDDALQLHEAFGRWFATRTDVDVDVAGLRGQDVGELVLWALVGVPLGAALVLGYLRGRPERPFAHRLLLCLAPLLVFGLGLDVVHIMVRDHVHPYVVYVLTWLEAAGELVGMSAVLGVVAHRLLRQPAPGPAAAATAS